MKVEIDRAEFISKLGHAESLIKADCKTGALNIILSLKHLASPPHSAVFDALEAQQDSLSDIVGDGYTWGTENGSYATLCNLITMLTAAKEELDK